MPTLNDVLLIAGSQGFLLCVVILSLRSGNRPASLLLAAFVGLESLHLFLLHVHSVHAGQAPAPALRLLFCLRLLDGPVLFLYVRALTESGFRLRLEQAAHAWVLVPALAWFGYLVTEPGWLLYSTVELQRMPSTIVISLCQSMIVFGYGMVARRRLGAHEYRLQQVLSATESLNLQWLRWLVTALIAVAALHMMLDLLRLLGQMDASVKYFVNLTVTILLIYLISLGGLRQPQVFTQPVRDALHAVDHASDPPAVTALEAEGAERTRYRKSGLDETRSASIARGLNELLEVERCYLESTLDLPSLARRLSVRPQELSEVISTVFGSTFYELVNHARVEAAKALLQEPQAQRRKMLDIAMSVGFSSQSTFYSQFKRVTGKTPVAYRDDMHRQATREQVPEG
jgi:AraC-like DNA-binding protein